VNMMKQGIDNAVMVQHSSSIISNLASLNDNVIILVKLEACEALNDALCKHIQSASVCQEICRSICMFGCSVENQLRFGSLGTLGKIGEFLSVSMPVSYLYLYILYHSLCSTYTSAPLYASHSHSYTFACSYTCK
jgi:hypothetical protein